MNPKRRFFQIHLSTAVVLMLVAAVLLWANVRDQIVSETDGDRIFVHGWSYAYLREVQYADIDSFGEFERERSDAVWTAKKAVLNVLVALAILLPLCAALEWRILRPEDLALLRRRFLTIHPRTAALLTVVAALLLWANLRKQIVIEPVTRLDSADKPYLHFSNEYGWPFECALERVVLTSLGWRTGEQPRPDEIAVRIEWKGRAVVYDALMVFAILLSVWQLGEWRIRRRTAR